MIKTLLLTPLFFASIVTEAQQDSDEASKQWYQIELLVFTYENPDNANQELWPQELGLKYPQRIIELRSAAQSEILLNDQPADQAQDTINNTTTTQGSDNAIAADNEATVQLIDAADTATQPSPLLVKLDQQPFTLLEQDQLTFNKFSRRLNNRSEIRTLFHGAWRQAISERSEAESILIHGGEQYDDHYELEGSISLGLERYLHIKTDLWLSTFVSNIGREQHPWPILPKKPRPSLSIDDAQQQADPFSNNSDQGNTTTTRRYFQHQFPDMSPRQYAVDRTVALRQDRRMRSNELHYIDHPLIGLLVRITPYEFPAPDPIEAPSPAKEAKSNEVPTAEDTNDSVIPSSNSEPSDSPSEQ